MQISYYYLYLQIKIALVKYPPGPHQTLVQDYS